MRGTEFHELSVFLAVLEERSFRRAAARLGMTPSAISHVIRGLEERLQLRLIHRTTRSLSPTEAGQQLAERIAPAFDTIHGAVDGLRSARGAPSGVVRINLPKIAADLVFGPVFGEFSRRYPDIRLELVIEDDLSDIVANGFDAGIRPGERLQLDMVGVRVTPPLRTVIVGSPDYFARRPPPQTPDELRQHLGVHYRWTRSGALYRWPLARAGSAVDVGVRGNVTVNDVDLLVQAALGGAGLVYTLEATVAAHLDSGRLRRVLPEWCPPFPGFHLYTPGRRQMAPALRALIDFLRARVEALDELGDGVDRP